jgi:hypothetical protein
MPFILRGPLLKKIEKNYKKRIQNVLIFVICNIQNL